jgi:apolipoprotein D and lipocalin family protein
MHKSIACIAALLICVNGCAYDPPAAQQSQSHRTACVAGPPIDLPRYMGRWFVIAETPYLNERDYVGSYDEWTLRADGKINDSYLGRRHGFDQPVTGSHFVAKVMPGTGNTTWRVGLIWPFEVVVVTAYVDADYRYTIRCIADGNTVWLLARAPTMDDATYSAMLARLAGMGVDLRRLHRVPQNAGQIGLPGFSETLDGKESPEDE